MNGIVEVITLSGIAEAMTGPLGFCARSTQKASALSSFLREASFLDFKPDLNFVFAP